MKYEIKGTPLPVVELTLDRDERVISESGAMCYMTNNMKMQTTTNGGIKKIFSRMFSGEKLFQCIYTAEDREGKISFASSFPGDIHALEVNSQKEYIVQKSCFLCGSEGINLSINFQKKIGTGLFGGEGFIMQNITGNGTAFIEIDGSPIEINLNSGEQILINTGHLVMMEKTCTMDIQKVGGFKNTFFGGQGIFNTVVTGPGRVILQTMPISKMADTLYPYLPIPVQNYSNE